MNVWEEYLGAYFYGHRNVDVMLVQGTYTCDF